MKVTIGLAVILSLFDQQAYGIKQRDPIDLKDDFITTAQLQKTKTRKHKHKHKKHAALATAGKPAASSTAKYESHDAHLGGLHLGDFQPSDIKKAEDNLSKKTKADTNQSKQTIKKLKYKKNVPVDEQETKESESVDAHIAGFHKHIDAVPVDPTANLENEIMGAVRMTDYDQLTKTYSKVRKDINNDVIKDKYQDQVPSEETTGDAADHYDKIPQKNLKTGEHADHYDDHGEEPANKVDSGSVDTAEPGSDVPHGGHADHYEEHGEGVDTAKPGAERKIPQGGHADHFEDHGEEKVSKKHKKKHHKTKKQQKVLKTDDDEDRKEQSADPLKEQAPQKPLVDQLDIKKSQDKADFDAQKQKMTGKIEKLPKPVAQEVDPNQPAEEKQPLEGSAINSGHLPNPEKPVPNEQSNQGQTQARTKAHQHKSKAKKHHHQHHAQHKSKSIQKQKDEKESEKQKLEVKPEKKKDTPAPAAPVSTTTIVPTDTAASNATNAPQQIQIVIQQQGQGIVNNTNATNSSQAQQPTVQSSNGGQQIIVSIPALQQQPPKAEVPKLTPLSELAQKKKVSKQLDQTSDEQLLEDDPYLHAESLNSSDQDAYPGLAVIYQKQEAIDKYMKV